MHTCCCWRARWRSAIWQRCCSTRSELAVRAPSSSITRSRSSLTSPFRALEGLPCASAPPVPLHGVASTQSRWWRQTSNRFTCLMTRSLCSSTSSFLWEAAMCKCPGVVHIHSAGSLNGVMQHSCNGFAVSGRGHSPCSICLLMMGSSRVELRSNESARQDSWHHINIMIDASMFMCPPVLLVDAATRTIHMYVHAMTQCMYASYHL